MPATEILLAVVLFFVGSVIAAAVGIAAAKEHLAAAKDASRLKEARDKWNTLTPPDLHVAEIRTALDPNRVRKILDDAEQMSFIDPRVVKRILDGAERDDKPYFADVMVDGQLYANLLHIQIPHPGHKGPMPAPTLSGGQSIEEYYGLHHGGPAATPTGYIVGSGGSFAVITPDTYEDRIDDGKPAAVDQRAFIYSMIDDEHGRDFSNEWTIRPDSEFPDKDAPKDPKASAAVVPPIGNRRSSWPRRVYKHPALGMPYGSDYEPDIVPPPTSLYGGRYDGQAFAAPRTQPADPTSMPDGVTAAGAGVVWRDAAPDGVAPPERDAELENKHLAFVRARARKAAVLRLVPKKEAGA